jgi:predicted dehydrogenase
MTPIGIGFIGLSKTGWATTAHIPYLSSSSKFKIVAICNSSVQSAREAVELYKLPAETASYGDPDDAELLVYALKSFFLRF